MKNKRGYNTMQSKGDQVKVSEYEERTLKILMEYLASSVALAF
jgi:hypothetical protein